MKEHISVSPSCHSTRWVSYLDLLGFSNLVSRKDWVHVFSYYSKALKLFIKKRGFEPAIGKFWFSDTFILYSPDNSGASFTALEATTRWFVYFLITGGIPVRGAMACGELYADEVNNLFFGKALIEAYYYGENQDWIGFIMCPSAVQQMEAVGLPAKKRLNYAYWKIPRKDTRKDMPTESPALIMGGSTKTNGRNICLEKLKYLRDRIDDPEVSKKYDHTIQFIEMNRRELGKIK